MLGTDEGPMLEMIEPMRDDSALKRFMDLRQGDAYPDGEGLYLVGMQVADLEAAVKRIEDARRTHHTRTGNGQRRLGASALERQCVHRAARAA